MEVTRTEGKGRSKQKEKREVEEDGEEEEEDDVELGFEEDEKKKRALTVASSAKKGPAGAGISPPRCQAEKCAADLTDAKRYHRRHKVCEHHSKASVVIVAGIGQRFCQQCSRFHELSEFDEAKRSCRRRLAGHNERRRKNPPESQEGPSRKGSSPQVKGNHCRQADEKGRLPTSLPGNGPYKHFQIR